MKIGYARVSTRDQKADLQVDALKQAGCERIYQDIASGAKSARPELDKLLANVRPGDAVVIWKLDRLGRSLKHLVELVGELAERKVGLQSLNDPIDTTHAQGRLVFNRKRHTEHRLVIARGEWHGARSRDGSRAFDE